MGGATGERVCAGNEFSHSTTSLGGINTTSTVYVFGIHLVNKKHFSTERLAEAVCGGINLGTATSVYEFHSGFILGWVEVVDKRNYMPVTSQRLMLSSSPSVRLPTDAESCSLLNKYWYLATTRL